MNNIIRFKDFSLQEGKKESWKKTSWESDGRKVTITQVIKHLDKTEVESKRIKVSDISDILIDADYNNRKERIESANLKYPIIIVKVNGRYKSILDGNHRLYKAIKNKRKTISARILDLDKKSTPKIYKELFN